MTKKIKLNSTEHLSRHKLLVPTHSRDTLVHIKTLQLNATLVQPRTDPIILCKAHDITPCSDNAEFAYVTLGQMRHEIRCGRHVVQKNATSGEYF